jgi:predicted amidophosphoribosyltransferase
MMTPSKWNDEMEGTDDDLCTVCEDRVRDVARDDDLCTTCRRNLNAEQEQAQYMTSDMIARDVRSSVVYDTAPSLHLQGASITNATRDGSGANFTITTSTGQTFRVIVTEIA